MSSLVLFDTSVFVDHLRTGQHQEQFESVSGLIRTSSVVLAELWRGATQPAEKAFLKELGKNHPDPDSRLKKTGWSRAKYSQKSGQIRVVHRKSSVISIPFLQFAVRGFNRFLHLSKPLPPIAFACLKNCFFFGHSVSTSVPQVYFDFPYCYNFHRGSVRWQGRRRFNSGGLIKEIWSMSLRRFLALCKP